VGFGREGSDRDYGAGPVRLRGRGVSQEFVGGKLGNYEKLYGSVMGQND
jgi:hypothetical protein